MIWATVSSQSCFCWLYRTSPSLAAKNIINLISVLTIWWCPCVESSLVLLEEVVCYDQRLLCIKQLKLYFYLFFGSAQNWNALSLKIWWNLPLKLLGGFLGGKFVMIAFCYFFCKLLSHILNRYIHFVKH